MRNMIYFKQNKVIILFHFFKEKNLTIFFLMKFVSDLIDD